MSYPHSDPSAQEALVYEYIEALESGDFDTIALLMELAEDSPALEAAFDDIHHTFYDEGFAHSTTQNAETLSPTVQNSHILSIEEPDISAPQVSERPIGHDVENTTDGDQTKRSFLGYWLSAAVLCAVAVIAYQPLSSYLTNKASETRRLPGPESIPTRSFAQQQAGICTKDTRLPKRSWVEKLHKEPDTLAKFLNQKEALRQDTLTLMQNQHLVKTLGQRLTNTTLSDLHRIIRARLLLRMARFHKQNYHLSLQFHKEVFARRLKRKKKLQLGQHFYYYWGRLQCLRGYRRQATTALQRALKNTPKHRHDRIKAWMYACRSTRETAEQTAQQLAKLTFPNDPDGWTEWILLHHLFGLTPQRQPATPTQRAALYERVRTGQRAEWSADVQRMPVDQETLQEQGIRTKLTYFDPTVFLMMSHDFAQRALTLLRQQPDTDRYAPFYVAEAHSIRAEKKQARIHLFKFLQQPPRRLRLSYLLFSHRLSPRQLRQEACFQQARLVGPYHKDIAERILSSLATQDHIAKSLAGLGFLHLHTHKQQSYQWLLKGAEHAQAQEKELAYHYIEAIRKTEDETLKKGAKLIVQLRLYRYQVRAYYLWGSIGAILAEKGDKATWWMEQLHRKEDPYKITGENEPFQFAWTINAYTHAGKLGIATLFFHKNKDTYPSLIQLWSLIKMWRIYEGMDGIPLVKTG
ncbi:MAG: hypothetical protein CL920_35840 [Deltaproteobacteria bacterium]|nr:hypothetical protein [Deltaproteobacteria bacterium]MBU54099.1 hypothetical protein [Deltaproteobacteria bacterium]|tara:strand:+ start:5783 stop:7858 length:2076 start_codon:yes stop_codon:yes gene_type:complete